MFQGNWKCSKCGGAITELPFQPRSEAGLTCRTCFIAEKNGAATTAPPEVEASSDIDDRNDIPPFDPNEGSTASEPVSLPPELADAPKASGEKKLFQGDWQCSLCGNQITSLPFEPRSTANLKCIDCFKKG